jgi:hypothetical protein
MQSADIKEILYYANIVVNYHEQHLRTLKSRIKTPLKRRTEVNSNDISEK